MEAALRDRLGAALGSEVTSAVRLGGGDVAQSSRVQLADGRTVFAKTRVAAPPGCFETEALGLRWLADPGVIPVPDVLAVADRTSDDDHTTVPFLALSWIDEARRPPGDEAAFGRALARLHRSGAPSYGRADRRATGSRNLPNEPLSTWVEFFATQRLLPLVRMAREARAVDAKVLAGIERIAERLDAYGAADESPARLHGDLWAGNRIVDQAGESWLIDPAAHGGHREFDLAMMRLFGGFGPDAFAAYATEHPLAAGWERRVPLHQLAPLLVHAIKFGGSYPAAVARAVGSLR